MHDAKEERRWRKIRKSNNQVKSKSRVRDYGEVFTAEREVKAMCDLIPEDVWNNIDSTFLEPCCGNGNFVAEILERKLHLCHTEDEMLRAVKSIYAVDIQADNVLETRLRILGMLPVTLWMQASEIVAHNVMCGDSLKIMERLEREQNAQT